MMARRILPRLLLIGCCSICPVILTAADNPVQQTHELTLQWTRLAHQKDVLEANWRRDKPILEQQLSLLEREARELEALLEESEQEQDDVEQRRLELLEQQSQLEAEQQALARSLEQATIRIRSLQLQLPPPLSEAWDEELPRLGGNLLTASEKLQLVLDLLGQLDNFQQRVTLHETVMTLGDGQEYMVKQVYLGLSHGWYVTADRQFAAAGKVGAEGWQWAPVPEAETVADIIAILERRLSPGLISIPLQLNAANGGGQ